MFDLLRHKVSPATALQTLQAHGLIEMSHPDTPNLLTPTQADTPWFLQAVLGISGVVAGLFLTAFLALVLFTTMPSSGALIATGAMLLAGAFGLFRGLKDRDHIFLESLAFAISLAGQAYVGAGLGMSEMPATALVAVMMVVQVVLWLIVPNFLHRLFSSFFALGCALFLLAEAHASELGAGMLALIASVCLLQRYELIGYVPKTLRALMPEMLALTKTLGYASSAMLLLISVYFISAEHGVGILGQVFFYDYRLAQGVLLLASLYASTQLLRRYDIAWLSPMSVMIAVAMTLLAVVSTYVSGLLATSLVIVLAVATGQRILAGLGITALVGYVFWYYYQLDTTLLMKSASMLVVGISLLTVRHVVVKRYFTPSDLPTDTAMRRSDYE